MNASHVDLLTPVQISPAFACVRVRAAVLVSAGTFLTLPSRFLSQVPLVLFSSGEAPGLCCTSAIILLTGHGSASWRADDCLSSVSSQGRHTVNIQQSVERIHSLFILNKYMIFHHDYYDLDRVSERVKEFFFQPLQDVLKMHAAGPTENQARDRDKSLEIRSCSWKNNSEHSLLNQHFDFCPFLNSS